MTSHANGFSPTGRPLTEQLVGVVNAAVGWVVEGVVEGVAEGVVGAFLCLFWMATTPVLVPALVQGAVEMIVTYDVGAVLVAVVVTFVMGTKDEQKAEALRAISTALHTSTLLRASSSARGRCTAEADKRRADAPKKMRRKCMVRD